MFRNIPVWIAVLAAVSNTLASPFSSEARFAKRQVETAPGPECATIFCDLPACIGTPLCQSVNAERSPADSLTNRQFDCPPGINCGHGPECTPELCNIPGCADAEVCTSSQDRKRNAETEIVHPICDICIVGDNGVPVCGCATTNGTPPERRDTEKVCPLFCITIEDDEILCGCAAEDYEESLHGDKLTV